MPAALASVRSTGGRAMTYISPNTYELDETYNAAAQAPQDLQGSDCTAASWYRVFEACNPLDTDWEWLRNEGLVDKAVALVSDMRLFDIAVVKCGNKGNVLHGSLGVHPHAHPRPSV